MINEELNGHLESPDVKAPVDDADAEHINENVSTQENVTQPQLQMNDSNPPADANEQKSEENHGLPTTQEPLKYPTNINLLNEDFESFTVPQSVNADQTQLNQKTIQPSQVNLFEDDEFDQEVTSQIQDTNIASQMQSTEQLNGISNWQPGNVHAETKPEGFGLKLREYSELQVSQTINGNQNQDERLSDGQEDQFDGFQTTQEVQSKLHSIESQNFQPLYLSNNPSEMQTPIHNQGSNHHADIFQEEDFQHFTEANATHQIVEEKLHQAPLVESTQEVSPSHLERNEQIKVTQLEESDHSGEILKEDDEDEFTEPVEVQVIQTDSNIVQQIPGLQDRVEVLEEPQNNTHSEDEFDEPVVVQVQVDMQLQQPQQKPDQNKIGLNVSDEFSDPVEVRNDVISNPALNQQTQVLNTQATNPQNSPQTQNLLVEDESDEFTEPITAVDSSPPPQLNKEEIQDDDFDEFVEPEIAPVQPNLEQLAGNANQTENHITEQKQVPVEDDDDGFGEFNEVQQQEIQKSETNSEKLIEGDSMDDFQEPVTQQPIVLQTTQDNDDDDGFDDFEEAVEQPPNKQEEQIQETEPQQQQINQTQQLPVEDEVQFNLASKDEVYISALFMSLVSQKPNQTAQPPEDYRFQAEAYEDMYISQRKHIDSVIPSDIWTYLPAKMEIMNLMGLKDVELKHQGSSPPLKTPALETVKAITRDVFTFENATVSNSVSVISNSVQSPKTDMLSKVEMFLRALPDYSCMFEQIQTQ